MSFSIYTQIAYLAWIVMFVVWMLGRIGNKKTIKKSDFGKYLLTTLSLYASYLLLFLPYFSKILPFQVTPQNIFFGFFGMSICLFGTGFAIWSRFALGKNWSGVIASEKENHVLVKNGPYGIIRHPIYFGFILAMLGFSLTVGYSVSYLAVLLGTLVLLIRISIEERLMREVFGESYENYSTKVKKLLPLIW